MGSDAWLEIPVFVHGVALEENPDAPITNSCLNLLGLVNKSLRAGGRSGFAESLILLKWGYYRNDASEDDKHLAIVESMVAEKALAAMSLGRSLDHNLNLIERGISWLAYRPLSEWFIYGLADLFYYVSASGETAVRTSILKQLLDQLKTRERAEGAGEAAGLSLTFFSHSAGSVITHDLLFNIFGRPIAKPRPYDGYLKQLHDLHATGRLRVRKYYSMGMPLTPLFLAPTLYRRMSTSRRTDVINPADIGLFAEDDLSNPRMVNFWDTNDPGSFPIEFLYEKAGGEKVVVDKQVSLGGALTHNRYWGSALVAKLIADTIGDDWPTETK